MGASSAGKGSPEGVDESRPPRQRRRWHRKRASLRASRAASAGEAWSWSLGVSDWPIGKTDYDLSADQAVNAVLDLHGYYDRGMTGLSEAHDEEDGTTPDEAPGQP